MALRNIVTEGDEVLRKKCREVKEITDHVRVTLQDMLDTMHEQYGVGIAAPQVGVLRRMFIAEPVEGEIYYMINPVMLEQSGLQVDDEGCLSVPGKAGYVVRPNYVKIKALDLDGNEVIHEGTELLARAFLHENDHLDGILYIDKADEVFDVEPEEDE